MNVIVNQRTNEPKFLDCTFKLSRTLFWIGHWQNCEPCKPIWMLLYILSELVVAFSTY